MRLKPLLLTGAALLGGAVVVAVVNAARNRHEIHTGFGAVPRQPRASAAVDNPTDEELGTGLR